MSPVGEAPSAARVGRFLALSPDRDLLRRWAAAEGLAGEPFDAFYALVLEHSWIHLAQCRQALGRMRGEPFAALSPRDRARLDRLEANVRRLQGELEEARELYRRADAAFAQLGDRLERVRCAVGWIDLLVQLGRYPEALDLAQRSLRRLGGEQPILRAKIEFNRAVCLKEIAGFERARRAYQRVLALVRPHGVPELLFPPLFALGAVYRESGQPERARRCYAELVELGRRAGNRRAVYGGRMGLNLVEWTVGDWARATRRAQEVERGLEEIGDVPTLANALYARSQILSALGAPEKAEPLALRAYRLCRGGGFANLTAMASLQHGQVLAQLDRSHDAARRFHEAEQILARLGHRRDRRILGLIQGEVLLDRGQPEEAARLLRPLLRLRPDESRHEHGSLARGLLAEIHLERGRVALALRLARQAHRDAQGIRARAHRPRFALTVARALSVQGRHDAAIRWLRRSVDEVQRREARLGAVQLLGATARSRARLHRRLVEVAWSSGGRGAARLALDLLGRLRSSSRAAELLAGREDAELRRLRTALTTLRDEALAPAYSSPQRTAALQERVERLEARVERSLATARRRLGPPLQDGGARDWLGRLEGRRMVLLEEERQGWCAYVADAPRDIRRVPLPDAGALLRGVWLPQRLLFEAAARTPAAARAELLSRTREEAWDALRRLHEGLWAPLELDERPVDLVAAGALHGLPLEALPWAEPGAPRPSVSRLPHPGAVGRLPRRRRGAALLLGGGTAGTRKELGAVRRHLREAGLPVRSGRRRRALAKAGSLAVLHVAAHGVFHRRHWMLSGIELEDGWLGFEQLGEAGLKGALLFLSSCESGMAHDLPGAEMDGWLSAGLAAGVGEMVLALWKVDDAAATAFARHFYRRWSRGARAAEAAGAARARLLEERVHPWQWAPWLAMS